MKLSKIAILSAAFISLSFISCTKKPKTVQSAPVVQNCSRIVSLSPAASEILCAVGAFHQIVARTDFCDYPEQIKTLPSTGGFDGKTLSIETILSFNPDFVYATKGMHDQLLPLLEQQNIPYYLSTSNSVDEVLSEIEEIGRLTGHSKNAAEVTSKIKKELLLLKNENLKKAPVSVYWEIWNPPYISVGKSSFINDLINHAGGKNIFDSITEAYPIVSDEVIIAANPHAIIIADTFTGGTEAVKNRTSWQNISAVKNNRIYALNADIISRPGPRIAESARLISQALYSKD